MEKQFTQKEVDNIRKNTDINLRIFSQIAVNESINNNLDNAKTI